MNGTLTTYDVADLTGVPYRTVARWASEGLVTPAGGGRQRIEWVWQPKHVREVSIIHGLRSAGLSMQKVRDCFEYLRRRLGQNPASTGRFLVVRGRTGRPRDLVKLCDSGEAIALLNRRTRGQLVFPIASWADEGR